VNDCTEDGEHKKLLVSQLSLKQFVLPALVVLTRSISIPLDFELSINLAAGVKKLQINTNYINMVRFMMYFILKWEQNGWMTIRETPVKNQVVIRELDYFSRLIDVKWVNNLTFKSS
jgi:hypothetical protein